MQSQRSNMLLSNPSQVMLTNIEPNINLANKSSQLFLNQTQQKQTELTIPQEVTQLHQKLNTNINKINKQIEHVIQKNQSQFLYAYRNHLVKINKQLVDIKQKSEQQEKMFSANDRIKYLEKQVAVFREEALKVYEKLSKVEDEALIYKNKYNQMHRMYGETRNSSKNIMNQAKISGAIKCELQQKILMLQSRIKQKDKTIAKLERENKLMKQEKIQPHIGRINHINSLKSSKSRNMNCNISQSSVRYSSKNHQTSRIKPIQNQFQQFFFDCLRAVKKQITFRKYSNKLDLSTVFGLRDFQQIDKIRLLQLFLQNPELESWMYIKIFGNKTIEKMKGMKNIESLEQNHGTDNEQEYQTEKLKGGKKMHYLTKIGFYLPKMDPNRTKSTFPSQHHKY